MSLASFICRACGKSYHAHEDHNCNLWRVIAPDGREWTNKRLMAAVANAIEETKLQFGESIEAPTQTHAAKVRPQP